MIREKLGNFANACLGFIFGVYPNLTPLHPSYLSIYRLHPRLRKELGFAKGNILDVGCGTAPFKAWLSAAATYQGLDVRPGAHVTHLINEEQEWPIESNTIDVVIANQVLEHFRTPELFVKETQRVLRVGGILILAVPFIYNEHGCPQDFRRYSLEGIKQDLSLPFEILYCVPHGGIGSTLVTLFVNWIELQILSRFTFAVRFCFIPAGMAFYGALNSFGWILDRVDSTNRFYNNVIVRCQKRSIHV